MRDFTTLFNSPYLVSLVLLWSLIWKGIALWQAAGRRHITWYVLLLVMNTLGILEILYIFFLHRYNLKSPEVIKFWHKHFAPKK